MATYAQTRTPAHLWVVGALALLWNGFGAYDYVMTRTHNLAYLAKAVPGADPRVTIAWVESMPMYAQISWGLGVWGALLGAILLLLRSRYALWAFAGSMVGIVAGIGHALSAGPPPGASGNTQLVMQFLVVAIGAALLAYCYAMVKRGVLR